MGLKTWIVGFFGEFRFVFSYFEVVLRVLHCFFHFLEPCLMCVSRSFVFPKRSFQDLNFFRFVS